jgi:hypothetical protein
MGRLSAKGQKYISPKEPEATFLRNAFRLNEQLAKLHTDKPYLDLYKDILKHRRSDIFIEQSGTQKTIAQNIERLIERILKVK